MNNRDQLVSYLEELTRRTASGAIAWAEVNPSTYAWLRSTALTETLVSIQRAQASALEMLTTMSQAPGANLNYLLTVKEMARESTAKGNTVLAISTAEKKDLRPALETLFAAAQDSSEKKAVTVLKGLLS